MSSIFFSDDVVLEAVAELRGLSSVARKLLSEVITDQVVERKKVSPTMQILEDIGFISIRQIDRFSDRVEICSTLIGEEALFALEPDVE